MSGFEIAGTVSAGMPISRIRESIYAVRYRYSINSLCATIPTICMPLAFPYGSHRISPRCAGRRMAVRISPHSRSAQTSGAGAFPSKAWRF